jgi:hypothetical protein
MSAKERSLHSNPSEGGQMLRYIMQLLGMRRSGWRSPTTRGRRMGMLPVGGLLPLAWLAWTNRDHIRNAIHRVREGGVKALLPHQTSTTAPTGAAAFR